MTLQKYFFRLFELCYLSMLESTEKIMTRLWRKLSKRWLRYDLLNVRINFCYTFSLICARVHEGVNSCQNYRKCMEIFFFVQLPTYLLVNFCSWVQFVFLKGRSGHSNLIVMSSLKSSIMITRSYIEGDRLPMTPLETSIQGWIVQKFWRGAQTKNDPEILQRGHKLKRFW